MLKINKVLPSAAYRPGEALHSSVTDSQKSFMRILKRQFWLFVILIGCAISLGLLYLYVTPPSFTATSTMVIDTRKIQVLQQQSVLGSSLARLESASTYAQTDATNRTAAASILVAADPATVATQLSAAETQNQALMSVIGTVEKQSLFNYLQG